MEQIYKLQPDRCLALRGFDSFAAAAALHDATPTSFKVSGTFRDPADFAVLMLWDADNYYEHASIKYLPDFDFSGLVLTFNLQYSDGVQPIDSPKYNWIDWATLDCILVYDDPAHRPRIRLWDYATLAAGKFTPASGTFTLAVGANGIQAGDRLTLWFENVAFDYTAPAGATLATAAAALRDAINNTNWALTNRSPALLAASAGANVTIQAARHGWVNTTGPVVTWSAGTPASNGAYPWSEKFTGLAAGDALWLNQTAYTIASVQSSTQVTLSNSPPGNLQNAQYVAPRGGRDGNMFTLYSTAQPPSGSTTPNLTTQPAIQLSGGDSTITWNIKLDFSALQINQLRQCWLTFAPSLANGKAYSDTNWVANFTNWNVTGNATKRLLKIAGAGSVRVEENSDWCKYTGFGWAPAPGETGFYSKYAAAVARNKIPQLDAHGNPLKDSKGNPVLQSANNSVTITYQCGATHDLYVGTSLYTDRGIVSVQVDGNSQPDLNCYLAPADGAAVVTRRKLKSGLPAGPHSVKLTMQTDTGTTAKSFYFDYLEAAVPTDWPGPSRTLHKISPALDYDTDHTYKLSPARVMWIFDQLGFAGPVNEYMGVFWWNQRTGIGAVFPKATVSFGGKFASGDAIFLNLNGQPDPANPGGFIGGDTLGKSIFPADTPQTIATHFAAYINASSTAAWAAANGPTLTVTSRSPAAPYALSVQAFPAPALGQGSTGTVAVGPPPVPSVLATWQIDTGKQPTLNQSVSDWHADFYAQCAKRKLEVTTAGSMELVLPPSGFSAMFPPDAHGNQTAVSTATGFGTLNSNHCAIGSSLLLAYQKQFYRAVAALQAAAGLTPSVQFGEFLWWFFGNPQNAPTGMAYFDSETTNAARQKLGRALHVFLTPNDDPTVNNSADAIFLRNRLRDHVAALVTDLRSAFPNAKCEVLFPYDVNFPTPVQPGSQLGGRLNRFINLPVEWQQQSSSGLDRMKVEALQFTTQFRSMDLAKQAVQLMTKFGWPRGSVRYLAPVFGTFQPFGTEVGLCFSENLSAVNLWAYDHVCLMNLDLKSLREPTT